MHNSNEFEAIEGGIEPLKQASPAQLTCNITPTYMYNNVIQTPKS